MAIEKQASCQDQFEQKLMPVSQAQSRIESMMQVLKEVECLPIREALNRVLATDIISTQNIPLDTNSAMDGYAINADDIPTKGEKGLNVLGVAWAGTPFEGPFVKQGAVRIMTGAVMPVGTDTVVIQEHVRLDGDIVYIDAAVEKGRNVRYAGEDVKTGDAVLSAGTLLQPAHLGMLASLGVANVDVTRRVRVAFFSTGDELRSLDNSHGEPLKKGEIFDSNRYALYGMLKRLDVEIMDLGVVPDQPKLITETFEKAAEMADIVLTSGGVSVGDADYVSKILHEIGDISFWKLAMRPGRPMAFGKLGNAIFFGLPGNPVAVMVAFYEFVQPAIRQLMGCSTVFTPKIRVRSASAMRKPSGRTEFQRGILFTDAKGRNRVKTTGKQGAGKISSMCLANCLIVIEPQQEDIKVDDWVSVQPFNGLV